MTVGTLTTHRNINKWLHYIDNGVEKYVSMVNIKHSITYNQLLVANVIDDSKTITIDGKTYKVRLLKGIRENTEGITWSTGYDTEITHGSEWNRLIYPLLPPFDSSYPQDSQVVPDFANYAPVNIDAYPGSTTYRSWCQENWNNSTNFVHRGYSSLSNVGSNAPTYTNTAIGWRPCLELVTD